MLAIVGVWRPGGAQRLNPLPNINPASLMQGIFLAVVLRETFDRCRLDGVGLPEGVRLDVGQPLHNGLANRQGWNLR